MSDFLNSAKYGLISFKIAMLGAMTISSGVALAQSDDFAACISAGVPLYTISSERYSRSEVESAFYSKFCKVQRDWSKLSKENQEGVRTSWLGPYGDFAGDWSKGGTITSEEEHYKASCNVLDASYKGTFVDALRVKDIRGNVDALIEACSEAVSNGVRMIPQLPSAPSGQLVMNFKTGVADRFINGISETNLSCKMDGADIDGGLKEPRLITNNAAQIICTRDHRPVSVYGEQGDYYPPADIVVTTNYAAISPVVSLPEEVNGILITRIKEINDNLNSFKSLINGSLSSINSSISNITSKQTKMDSKLTSNGIIKPEATVGSGKSVWCPPGKVVVGISARNPNANDFYIMLRCAAVLGKRGTSAN